MKDTADRQQQAFRDRLAIYQQEQPYREAAHERLYGIHRYAIPKVPTSATP